MINIFQPDLGEEELKLVSEVFSSNWIGKGDYVLNFEREFAKSLQSNDKHFVSTNSCTEALFLASKLYNFNINDEIIAPSISFGAVGNCIVDAGAKLVLCDVDKNSLNTTASFIEEKITNKTKAVIITHFGGVPCEMDEIITLCNEKEILLIEDSACCPKSFYKNKAIGTMGDMGMWSFDAMKIICTGDGGMMYLRNLDDVEIIKELLYLGLSNRQKSGIDSFKGGDNQWWEYQITRPGRRSIMNNISGAIGLAQLSKLDHKLARRKEIHQIYFNALSLLDWLILPPVCPSYIESSFYFFWVQLEKRDEFAKYLKSKDIYTTFRYYPLHRVSFFQLQNSKLPNSDYAADSTLCIPLHSSLSNQDVNYIIETIKSFESHI